MIAQARRRFSGLDDRLHLAVERPEDAGVRVDYYGTFDVTDKGEKQ